MGSYPELSLKEARESAESARKLVKQGLSFFNVAIHFKLIKACDGFVKLSGWLVRPDNGLRTQLKCQFICIVKNVLNRYINVN